ncbi:MFS transporter [Streptomyces sp. PsTaAH-124]|uniref:MFS transporter n=1 Tax=Streptomyces sp. PsTaAH-124 TaxID=1157638 RepID=UPI0003734736|nr:MFS transporter [Streptomyces sp. PsTaAH-124]
MYISSSRATATPRSPGTGTETDPATTTATGAAGPEGPAGPAGPGAPAEPGAPPKATARTRATARVSPNVLALGSVSLVTDISSEMITAVLPMYVIFTLGLSPLQFGALNGMYVGVTALVRVAGGHAADRWQRRKLVAGGGYALSAVCKLGLLAAGSSVPVLGAVIAADRTGKGLRTGPRDALISLSSTPQTLGRSFGVHRALDTVGAFLGPLVAFALLLATPGRYDTVFVVSFGIAALGVLMLVLLVRERRTPAPAGGPAERAGLRDVLALLRHRAYLRVGLAAVLLSAVVIGDSFVYLLLQERLGVPEQYFPLLPLGTAGGYLLLAVPMGRLADRVGRLRVFAAGHGALLAGCLLLFLPWGGIAPIVAVLALHGVFYASTDGVLMAAVGPMVPERLRAGGLSLIQTAQSVAALAASVLFGACWSLWGLRTALAAALVALAVASALAVWILPWRTERRGLDGTAGTDSADSAAGNAEDTGTGTGTEAVAGAVAGDRENSEGNAE